MGFFPSKNNETIYRLGTLKMGKYSWMWKYRKGEMSEAAHNA
jgi:hypothetical protein